MANFPKRPDVDRYPLLPDAARGFIANANRLYGLTALPVRLPVHAKLITELVAQTAFSVSKRKHIVIDEMPRPQQQKAMSKANKAYVTFIESDNRADKSTEDVCARHRAATGVLRDLLSLCNDETQAGFEAALASALVTAWTVFEVLGGDLWEECLNARPARALIAARVEVSDDDDENERERKQKHNLPINSQKMLTGQIDPAKPGTILIEYGGWNFSKKGKLKEAYRRTFRESKDEVDAIFDCPQLRWLEALRNMIVHNGCVVDDMFLQSVFSHPELGKCERGKSLLIHGDLLGEFVPAVVQQGIALLNFVHKWMEANPR